jgi:cyclohexyl-isocyanide hydratase
MTRPIHIGLLAFPDTTQLDLTGPLQVFAATPNVRVHLLWKRIEPVRTDTPLVLTPTLTLAAAPRLDVVCVPGGFGTDALLDDDEVLGFLRAQAAGARYVTSVCTGALVLGAAGLLRGYRATTHWSALDLLPRFGAVVSRERVCIDRDRVTGGGVTAGIDFALSLVAGLAGVDIAQDVQLRLEYRPEPPFDAGSPGTAPMEVLERRLELWTPALRRRADAVDRAARRMAAA